MSVWTWARSPLFSSNQNFLHLSNRANWDKLGKGEKDVKSAMFSWTSPLLDREVPNVLNQGRSEQHTSPKPSWSTAPQPPPPPLTTTTHFSLPCSLPICNYLQLNEFSKLDNKYCSYRQTHQPVLMHHVAWEFEIHRLLIHWLGYHNHQDLHVSGYNLQKPIRGSPNVPH